MSKHTPGPWKATCLDRSSPTKVMYWDIEPVRKDSEDYRGDIASVHASEHIGGITVEERDANARLIAAAPELLAVLKRVTSAVDFNGTCHPLFDGMQKQITDAIAKAEGRS